MRAKLWIALGALVVMALGITAGTMALFSAQTANSDASFMAGTLNLDSYRDQGDSIPGPMFYTTPLEGQTPGGVPGNRPTGLWAPGDTNMRVLMIRNTGSLDALLTGVRASMHVGSSRALADKLEVRVTTAAPAGQDPFANPGAFTVLASGTMGAFIDNDQMFPTKQLLVHGPAPKPLYFWVRLPLDADNSYQNTSLYVDFTVYGEQKRNNP
ncbi:MAG TPA: hypothetical protein VGK74_08815 [Symbiobacteriaceae bacterium]|jgi:predicted ribosomally synthesized peptide with SipW-like signal peptide